MKQCMYDAFDMCSVILAIICLPQIWILYLHETVVGKCLGIEDTSVSLGPDVQPFCLLHGFPLCLSFNLFSLLTNFLSFLFLSLD